MTRWVSLGEDINKLVSRGDGEQLEIAFLEMLASNVAVDLNVLGVFMEYIIINNVDSTTIVTIKRSGSGLWSIHFSQELAKPNKLASGVGKGHNTQPQYWNEKPHPASCCATRQEKYLTGNRNL